MTRPPAERPPQGGQERAFRREQGHPADGLAARQAQQQVGWFKFISDHSNDAHFFADRDGRFLYVNAVACQRLGYPADELLGLSVPDVDPNYDLPHYQQFFDRLQGGPVAPFESVHRRKDGSTFPVELSTTGVRFDGQPFLFAVARDITEHKRAEDVLRQSQQQLAAELAAMTRLHELSTRLQAVPDLRTALEEILDAAIALQEADFGNVQLYDPRAKVLEIVAQRGFEQAFLDCFRRVDVTADSACARAMRSRARVVIEDVQADPGYEPYRAVAAAAGYRAVVSTPLLGRGGEFLGMLSTHFHATHRPSERDRRMLDLFARQAADRIDRIRAEDALRDSEERLRAIIDNCPSVIFVKDAEGRYLLANQACEGYSGDPPERMIGKTDRDYLPSEFAEPFRADDLRVLHTGEVARYEEKAPCYGTVRSYLTVKFPLRDASGQPYAVCGIATDITPLKEAYEELQASRSRLDLVVNSVDVGLWYCDLPFDKLVWNAKTKEHFGLPADAEVTIETFYERLHPDDRERTRQAIERSIEGHTGYDIEYRTVGLDGQERWLRAIGRAFYDADGKPVSFDGITVDVTERVRQQQALQDADRRKDEFLAMLAHELRNPLAPVRNALHILRVPGLDEATVGRAREMMERQVEHLVRLVDDLLDVSRLMRGKIVLRTEPLQVAAVVARAVETVQPVIDAQGHELNVTLPPEPLLVEGDLIRLSQGVSNLLTNAAKYTEKAGRISLTVERDRGQVVLRVQDNGIGIPPEMLPKVFELFTQADRSLDRSQGGLGIGLTLVKRLVEMHHGSVDAFSQGPGKGSTFTIRLPLLQPPDVAVTKESQQGGNVSPQLPALPRRRILVVDDNVDAAESLAMMLRMWHQDVLTVHDGPKALAVAPTYRPEMVILDIGLPGISGYEVARRLREDPAFTDVMLVAMTGYGQDEDRRRSQEAGFDHHLTKPANPDELQTLVAEVAARNGRK